MHKLNNFFSTVPLFIFLLPFFFVLHGFAEYFFLIPVPDALKLVSLYLFFSILFMGAFWLFYKNWVKAAIMAAAIMAFELFFGSIHDALKSWLLHTLFVRYSFLIPFILIMLLLLVIYLKKSKSDFTLLAKYLNWTLCILILIDFVTIALKCSKRTSFLPGRAITWNVCDTCNRPDIFLILADEYPGKQELKDLFSFDNTPFENALHQRGFFLVNNSRSNYNSTPYSMASMLNMDYLNLKTDRINMYDIVSSEEAIKNNTVLKFFRNQGYTIYNYSPFDIEGHNSLMFHAFIADKKLLISTSTFTSRFQKDAGFNFQSKKEREKLQKIYLLNNVASDRLTRGTVMQHASAPKFVYTHLMLPHPPYFFDSLGKEVPADQLESITYDRKAIIEYLVYSNSKILALIDQIRSASAKPPVIILMSDHGMRQFDRKVDHRYYFMTLNAILLPDHNYSSLYPGMTNVNEMRVLLNTEFKQRLPLLKDSSSFLY